MRTLGEHFYLMEELIAISIPKHLFTTRHFSDLCQPCWLEASSKLLNANPKHWQQEDHRKENGHEGHLQDPQDLRLFFLDNGLKGQGYSIESMEKCLDRCLQQMCLWGIPECFTVDPVHACKHMPRAKHGPYPHIELHLPTLVTEACHQSIN